MLKNMIMQNRSYRRFFPDPVSDEELSDLVDHARLAGCAKNMQTIRYRLSSDSDGNDLIYSCLAWAGFLKNWPGPEPDERSGGYIIMLHDTSLNNRWIDYDLGIAAQSILLAAVEKGLGGCIIAAIRKEELRRMLDIDPRFEIKLVLAIGKPKERIVLDEIELTGDTRYWRETNGTHHVPKRQLKDIIL